MRKQKSLQNDAKQWLRANRRQLIDEAYARSGFDSSLLDPSVPPAATFMAGTPGAGKTEVSKRFAEQFGIRPVRIDTGEFREQFPGYDGANSSEFQIAATNAVQKVLDEVFDKNYPFILDGTFAYRNAIANLKRADRHGYTMQIIFVYQDPVKAWEFTKARAKFDGRIVPKDVFIKAYFDSRKNVEKAKAHFGSELLLTVVVKDYDESNEQIYTGIESVDSVLQKIYNEDELERLLA